MYSSSLQLDRSIFITLYSLPTQLYLQVTLKQVSRKWKVGMQWYLSTTRTAYSSSSLYASCLFSARVISLTLRLRLIAPTSTLIILDIKKKTHPIIFWNESKISPSRITFDIVENYSYNQITQLSQVAKKLFVLKINCGNLNNPHWVFTPPLLQAWRQLVCPALVQVLSDVKYEHQAPERRSPCNCTSPQTPYTSHGRWE